VTPQPRPTHAKELRDSTGHQKGEAPTRRAVKTDARGARVLGPRRELRRSSTSE
jgi:hypothetical protein